jgi:outer membrane receptor protein involved in Fe transport
MVYTAQREKLAIERNRLNVLALQQQNTDLNLMGKDTWDFGALIAWRHKLGRKVDFRVQLNIQNLLNETDPLLTAVDTDTNSVYGTAHAAVPVYYTLLRPRNFVLSTTFDF